MLQMGPGSGVVADVLWSSGSVHNTYKETTCRLEGGSFDDATNELVVERALYSNGPWEYWEATLLPCSPEGSSEEEGFVAVAGRYDWHGWDRRRTSGHLLLELMPRERCFREPGGSAEDWLRRRAACAASHGCRASSSQF